MVDEHNQITVIVKDFADALRKRKIDFDYMVLFGSHADGQANDDSDIDVAVVSQEFGKEPLKEAQNLYKIMIEDKLDLRIEPRTFSSAEIADGKNYFAKEILAKGIVIK